MAKVTVYRFTCYDIHSDERIASRRMATSKGVEIARGEIIAETAIEIDDFRIGTRRRMDKAGFRPLELSSGSSEIGAAARRRKSRKIFRD